MTTTTYVGAPPRTRRSGLVLGSVAGAALLVAGVWNALLQEHVTVSSPPPNDPGLTTEQSMHTWYTWYAGTVAQDRAITVAALIGVTGLVLLADALRRRVAGKDVLARAACTALGLGGVVWMTGALLGIGGHRAVGLMATHANPVQGVNSIAFTVDMTVDAFSTAAFVLLGIAMVAIGIAPVRLAPRGWAVVNIAAGVVAFVVAVGFVQNIDFITTYVLGLLAVVLLPLWTIAAGTAVDVTADAPSGAPS